MDDYDPGDPQDGTTRIVRNVLALLVSSAIMGMVGVPVMLVEYDSGGAALAGTVALVVGLVVAVWVTLKLLEPLEGIAETLVAAYRGRN